MAHPGDCHDDHIVTPDVFHLEAIQAVEAINEYRRLPTRRYERVHKESNHDVIYGIFDPTTGSVQDLPTVYSIFRHVKLGDGTRNEAVF